MVNTASIRKDEFLLEGDEKALRVWCASARRNYVYILLDPSLEPFYVGVGTNYRVLDHTAEARRGHSVSETNPHRCRKIRKIERSGGALYYRIDSIHLDRSAALSREGALILEYGRACDGGVLTNIHPGYGTGLPLAPETIEKRSVDLAGYDSRHHELRELALLIASISSGVGKELEEKIKSNPLKPRSRYKRISETLGTTRTKALKLRSAAALAAVASCHNEKLRPGATIPRAFVYRGISAILENGCSNDILGSGAATIVRGDNPAAEALRLTEWGAASVHSILGKQVLERLDLL